MPTLGVWSGVKSSTLPVRVLWTRRVMESEKPDGRQKAKGKNQKATVPLSDCGALLIFAFCLLPFAFRPSFLVLAQLRQHRQILQRRRVAERLLAGGDVAQQAAHDLAAAGLGQGLGV